MPSLIERIVSLFQLYNRKSFDQGLEFLFHTILPNVSILAFVWFLFTVMFSGFLLLTLFDHSILDNEEYDIIETVCLSGALGICFLPSDTDRLGDGEFMVHDSSGDTAAEQLFNYLSLELLAKCSSGTHETRPPSVILSE